MLKSMFSDNLFDIFEGKWNKEIDPVYEDRMGRNVFAASELKKDAEISTILNLGGGGKRHLEKALNSSAISVKEVDMQGECDLQVDIDSLEQLPFQDQSFDVVCAFDVLEHLENFHLINQEMLRVSKRFMLISLPNSAAEIIPIVMRNKFQTQPNFNRGVFSIFYGIPLRKPDDRHRWWLYFQDIVRYYYYFSLENGSRVEFWIPRLNIKKKIFKFIFGEHIFFTFFCPTVWIKIYK